MDIERIGTAWGLDRSGEQRFVSVYRDGAGFKLSGHGGSHIVRQPALDAALAAVAEQYSLAQVEFAQSRRAS